MTIKQAAREWFTKDRPSTNMFGINVEYAEKVHEAWEQWQAALNYFEQVNDPELIDFAIYDIEATRRRYIYMLKKAENV